MNQVPRHRAVGLTFLCLVLAAAASLAQVPLTVGDHFTIEIDSALGSPYEVMDTERGRVYEISHPDATYIAIHFSSFNLAPGDRLIISDRNGGQSYELSDRGKMGAGVFWSQHVKGDAAVLEYVSSGSHPGHGFVIDEYAAGFVSLGRAPDEEAICGLDDKENAVCFSGSHPTEYQKAQAVARLLIQGSSLCTGWLASADDHLVTNEHCISSATAALNTDYEFAAEAPNCGDNNCQLCHPGVVFSGATFIQDNASLDYALVQINSGNPAATYGFLEIDNRVAVVGEEIYIPQHPGGRAKEFGINSSDSQDSPSGLCHVNTFANACSGGGYQDVGYQCDTEGGSSGSPVLARSSHQVIALHHCANCPNRGVPIDLVCAEICPLLGPACGNGTCEAGEDCNNCAADCEITTGGAVCGNGVCEAGNGEDCVSCAQDCNGKQNGNPQNRYCCGDGDGTNPVPCSDSRCTASGNTCTDIPVAPGTFCCGDTVCDPAGENCANCALDCTLGAEICTGGVDEDCDGGVDCNDSECSGDPACVCDARNTPCSTGSQCCSGVCKNNGRCR